MLEQETTIYSARAVYSAGQQDVGAFAAAGGVVVATGSRSELESRYPSAKRVDFGDATVVPGFNDAHTHLADTARVRLNLNVSPPHAPDAQTLLALIAQRAARGDDWVVAERYDDSMTGPIDRHLLDAAAPHVAVLVRHVSWHWAVLNSRALEALGITAHAQDPAGGTYERDQSGDLTGRIYERALLARYVSKPGDPLQPLPGPRLADAVSAYGETVAEWNSFGVTSTTDALVGGQQLAVHAAARQAGNRSMRVGALLSAELYDDFDALSRSYGPEDHWLRIAGVKAFVDGAVGGRTCLVSEPFCGTHDHGLQIASADELTELVQRVHTNGHRLGVHANGDAAIRMLLDAHEQAQTSKSGKVRHRIEHCSIVDDDIVRRIAQLGLVVTPLANYPSFYGGRLAQWYGDRTEHMFAHRAFLDAGVTVAASTDHPAAPISPMYAIQSMVTRMGDDGVAVGLSQAVTATTALDMYTAGSAAATGEEKIKGRLVAGMLADFAVLDRDPRKVDPGDIADIGVLHTYVGGANVFSRV